MATDATGTPTSPDSIPKYNTTADAPSGLGFNAAMDAIQVAVSARAKAPVGIASGEAMIWNGATFVRSSVTGLTPSGIAAYPADGTKALFGDGTWKVASTAVVVAPTFISVVGNPGASTALVANQACLLRLDGAGLQVPFLFTRFLYGLGASSGNMDLGVYSTDDEVTWTRVFSTASFAMPAALNSLTKTVAVQTLTPVTGRRWFVAIAADNITATYRSADIVIPQVFTKITSFPLPASLTGVTQQTSGNFPIIGLAI